MFILGCYLHARGPHWEDAKITIKAEKCYYQFSHFSVPLCCLLPCTFGTGWFPWADHRSSQKVA